MQNPLPIAKRPVTIQFVLHDALQHFSGAKLQQQRGLHRDEIHNAAATTGQRSCAKSCGHLIIIKAASKVLC